MPGAFFTLVGPRVGPQTAKLNPMPRRSSWFLPCTLIRRTDTTTPTWMAELTVSYSPRRRVRGTGLSAPTAVARLVVRLRLRGYDDKAAQLRDAGAVQFGTGWVGTIAEHTPHAGPPLTDLLIAHVAERHHLGHLKRESYTRACGLIRNHVATHRIGGLKLTQLTTPDLRVFIESLMVSPTGPGATGTRSIHGYISQVCRQAVEDGRLARSPMDGVALPAKPQPKPTAVRTSPGSVAERARWLTQQVAYDDFLLLLPLLYGLRTNERLGLTHGALAYRPGVDLYTPTGVDLHVHAQLREDRTLSPIVKTHASYRILPLPPVVSPHFDALHLRRIIGAMDRGEDGTDPTEPPVRSSTGSWPSLWLTDDSTLYTDTTGRPLRRQAADKKWYRIRDAYLGGDGWRTHDWRGIVRSALMSAGVSDVVAESYLGHALSPLAATYAHVGAGDLAGASKVLAEAWYRWPEPYTGALPEILASEFATDRPPAALWRETTGLDDAALAYRDAAADGMTPAEGDTQLAAQTGGRIDLLRLAYYTAWWPHQLRAVPVEHVEWAREHAMPADEVYGHLAAGRHQVS